MKRIVLLIALASLAMLPWPATAAISDIPAGGTVFIGEQGLDITAGLGANNAIAWFPSTATSTSVTPEKVIDVAATKTSFYVNPTDFSSRTGNWYSWASGLTAATASVAFLVNDPYLSVAVEDMDAEGIDVSNKWLYRGDEAQFRIETNLYTMSARGVAGAPVTIKFQTPNGVTLTAVTNKAGTSNPLADIAVGTSPYTTGRFWASDNSQYSAGTYTIWAECNANGMNNIYPQAGKTMSPEITVLVQERNPLITVNTATTAATQTTAPVTTAVPTTAIATGTTATAPATTPGTAATPADTTVPGTAAYTETGTGQATTAPTYADGFCFSLAILACIAGCALYCIRRH